MFILRSSCRDFPFCCWAVWQSRRLVSFIEKKKKASQPVECVQRVKLCVYVCHSSQVRAELLKLIKVHLQIGFIHKCAKLCNGIECKRLGFFSAYFLRGIRKNKMRKRKHRPYARKANESRHQPSPALCSFFFFFKNLEYFDRFVASCHCPVIILSILIVMQLLTFCSILNITS